MSFYNLENYELAISTWKELRDKLPSFRQVTHYIGLAELKLGHLQKAEKEFKKSISRYHYQPSEAFLEEVVDKLKHEQ